MLHSARCCILHVAQCGSCDGKGAVDARSRCTALDAAAVRRARRSAHPAARVPPRPHRRRDSATSAPGLGHVGAWTVGELAACMPLRLSLCVWSKTLRWTMPWFSCLCVPATSALALGSPLPRLCQGRDWGSRLPHLHWDWAHPSHMWTAAAAAAASARLPRIYGPERLELIAHCVVVCGRCRATASFPAAKCT